MVRVSQTQHSLQVDSCTMTACTRRGRPLHAPRISLSPGQGDMDAAAANARLSHSCASLLSTGRFRCGITDGPIQLCAVRHLSLASCGLGADLPLHLHSLGHAAACPNVAEGLETVILHAAQAPHTPWETFVRYRHFAQYSIAKPFSPSLRFAMAPRPVVVCGRRGE